MKSMLPCALAVALFAASGLVAQGQDQPSNLQAPQDPRYAEVTAACRVPPGGAASTGAAGPGTAAPGTAARGTAARGTAARGAAAGRAGAAGGVAAPPTGATAGAAEYTVEAIPGVIAAGRRWSRVWETTGNNADGIIATDDGGLLLAQNDNGAVVKLDRAHQPSIAFRDTNTGGALSRSATGALFIAARGIGTAIWQLEPERRLFANRFQGEPLECLGGVLNDLVADRRGGVYFTMGGLFYADSTGAVTSFGENLRTNGVMLSPDEQRLYVTNGNVIVAFDVRADGSLTNGRDFATLPAGNGDGMAVDTDGRLYVTAGAGGGAPGVHVFATDGRHLGTIGGPRPFITAAFSGPEKRTLYAVANDRRTVEVYAIEMLAQGFRGRAK